MKCENLWRKQVKRKRDRRWRCVKKKEVRNRGVKESRGARSRCKRIRYAFNLLHLKFIIGNLPSFLRWKKFPGINKRSWEMPVLLFIYVIPKINLMLIFVEWIQMQQICQLNINSMSQHSLMEIYILRLVMLFTSIFFKLYNTLLCNLKRVTSDNCLFSDGRNEN